MPHALSRRPCVPSPVRRHSPDVQPFLPVGWAHHAGKAYRLFGALPFLVSAGRRSPQRRPCSLILLSTLCLHSRSPNGWWFSFPSPIPPNLLHRDGRQNFYFQSGKLEIITWAAALKCGQWLQPAKNNCIFTALNSLQIQQTRSISPGPTLPLPCANACVCQGADDDLLKWWQEHMPGGSTTV